MDDFSSSSLLQHHRGTWRAIISIFAWQSPGQMTCTWYVELHLDACSNVHCICMMCCTCSIVHIWHTLGLWFWPRTKSVSPMRCGIGTFSIQRAHLQCALWSATSQWCQVVCALVGGDAVNWAMLKTYVVTPLSQKRICSNLWFCWTCVATAWHCDMMQRDNTTNLSWAHHQECVHANLQEVVELHWLCQCQ